MPRLPIALALPFPLPLIASAPPPDPSPLQAQITLTLSSTDYDAVCLPLANASWQERWERLCLRPTEEGDVDPGVQAGREREREKVDREADVWRKQGGLRREEVNVTRLEETANMMVSAADWLELDSPDEGIRFDSELALRAELAQAIYLAIPTFIIPAPTLQNRAHLPSYARAISNLLQMGGTSAFTQISIRIPISDPAELIGQGPANQVMLNGANEGPQALTNGIPASSSTGSGNKHKRISSMSTRPASVHQAQSAQIPVTPQNMRVPSGASADSSTLSVRTAAPSGTTAADPSSTWEMWDCIRHMCGYHPRLTVTLDLSNPLPPSVGALARWTAEPVRCVWLPAGSFIPNAKGYPVLSKACQAFLRGMGRQGPTFVLSDTYVGRHPAGGPNAYLQYLRHITSQPPIASTSSASASSGPVPDYTNGYADYLQAPLQPLMDDLGSATYEVFERDPVKYRQYEEATYLALSDLPADGTYAVVVVGAGRGPLVDCTLRALQRSSRSANVYAVEKNANAFITLQEKKALEWHDKVEIFYGDMRNIDLPEHADIMISELLGSFGDNELSPECLDGAMRFLKHEGISIPISYTAHLAPISSAKLHADVSAPTRPAAAAETPYVVMMQAVNILSGDGGGVNGRCGERIQQCWQFEHPRRDLILDSTGGPLTNSHNTRSSTHTFHIPHAGPLHGLAGYFEAHLYSNIGLSIHPDNAHRVSPDMFSWFPLFFPLREPLYLPSGSELDVGVWRLWDSARNRIWYEWTAEAFLPVSAGGALGTATGAGLGLGPSATIERMSSITGNGNGNALNVMRSASLSTGPGPGGQPSPMMDAPFSPGALSFGGINGGMAGQAGSAGAATPEGRIKIGQTRLHNPGGVHSWVGL